MTTTEPHYRFRIRRGASTVEIHLPPEWTPTPPEQCDTMPGFCERCDQPARVPLGPGPGLCPACSDAEGLDVAEGIVARPRPVQRRALGRSRR
ncbi:MAG: hypothetical protein EPO40_02835 [Myxococcaceae bacterium]|nr:MAG: hypothetical protein EPO40_02835 [Myxococcaceae bacterium]